MNDNRNNGGSTKFILATVGLTAFTMMLTKKSFRDRLKRLIDSFAEMAEEETEDLKNTAEETKTKVRRRVASQLREASEQVDVPPVPPNGK